MILQCVFRVFRTFWGIKSAPGEKRNFPRGPLGAFFRSSRVLDQKRASTLPKKGSASKGENPKWKGREGVNPFPGTGNWGFMKALHAMRPKGLGGFYYFLCQLKIKIHS